MSLVSLFCFLALIIIVFSCQRKGADVFSPARIFGAVWFFSIGITDLKWSRFQQEWSTIPWLALVVGISAFFVGNFITYVLSLHSKEFTVNRMRTLFQTLKVDERTLFWGTVLFFTLYSISLSVEIISFGGVPMFSANPDRARIGFGLFGFHLFVAGGMPVVLVLATEYFLFVKARNLKKTIVAVMFLVTFLSHILLLVRYNYMVYTLIATGITYYVSKKMNFKNAIIAFSIIAGAFILMIQIRETLYIQHYIYVISRMKIPIEFEWVTGPYMYIAMNLENFAHTVDRIQQYTYGYHTFDFIWAITGLKHWISEYFGIGVNEYLVTGSFNTLPVFFYFLQDFGFFGLFVLSLISGMVVGLVYHWMKRTASLTAVVLYGCCIYLMGISFFNNSASHLNFNFAWISLTVVNLIVQQRSVMNSV